MVDETQASADAHAAQAAGSTATDQSTGSVDSTDVSKDIGGDERMRLENVDRSTMGWTNQKYTYDLFQSVNLGEQMSVRKHQAKLDSMEISEREQRLLHQANLNTQEIVERETARRHYEDNHTVRILALMGFTADTVTEALNDVIKKAAKSAG